MSMIKAAQLRKERQKLHEEQTAILQGAEKRFKKDPPTGETAFLFGKHGTPEERERWDNIESRFDELEGEIKRLESHEERQRQVEEDMRADRSLAASESRAADSDAAGRADGPAPGTDEYRAEQRRAVEMFYRYGYDRLGERARRHVGPRQTLSGGAQRAVEQALINEGFLDARAQSVGTAAAGGNLVPDAAMMGLVESQKLWGGMLRARTTILRTSDGRQIPIPTADDTSNSGALIAENTEMDELDITYGQKLLDAYNYTSKIVRVSRELLQDEAVNLEDHIDRVFGRRLGTAINAHLTTGSGSSQPNGVVTAATSGKTAASSSAFTYIELLDLKYNVDPAYRANAEWMYRDATHKLVKQLLDGNSRPLFQPDVQSGSVSRIDGDPIVINQDVAAVGSSAKPVLYGDFSQYYARFVRDIFVMRLVERFAEFNQVGFVAVQRADGELMDAGQNPIEFLTMAA